MSTRYLVAALLMTSACVAHADVLQSQATPRVSRMVTFMARPAAASLIAATPVDTTLSANATVMAGTTPSGVTAAADTADVPEPSSIALMMAGMFGVMGLRRRRNR